MGSQVEDPSVVVCYGVMCAIASGKDFTPHTSPFSHTLSPSFYSAISNIRPPCTRRPGPAHIQLRSALSHPIRVRTPENCRPANFARIALLQVSAYYNLASSCALYSPLLLPPHSIAPPRPTLPPALSSMPPQAGCVAGLLVFEPQAQIVPATPARLRYGTNDTECTSGHVCRATEVRRVRQSPSVNDVCCYPAMDRSFVDVPVICRSFRGFKAAARSYPMVLYILS